MPSAISVFMFADRCCAAVQASGKTRARRKTTRAALRQIGRCRCTLQHAENEYRNCENSAHDQMPAKRSRFRRLGISCDLARNLVADLSRPRPPDSQSGLRRIERDRSGSGGEVDAGLLDTRRMRELQLPRCERMRRTSSRRSAARLLPRFHAFAWISDLFYGPDQLIDFRPGIVILDGRFSRPKIHMRRFHSRHLRTASSRCSARSPRRSCLQPAVQHSI